MHHCLIANLALEIFNEIIALIRIAPLDSILSAGKKIIPPLVLYLGRASLASR